MTPQEECERFKVALRPLFQGFIAFCEEHHLTWYCAYGTTLGVARHQDFIPWDDDIDVFMPRDDYDRFLSLKSALKDTSFEILDWDDKGYFLHFAKFCDRNSTLIEREGERALGIYIDVFQLDYYDPEYSRPLQRFNQLYRYMWLTYAHGIRRHSWHAFAQSFKSRQIGRMALILADATVFRLLAWPAKMIICRFNRYLVKTPKSNKLWHYDIIDAYSNMIFNADWFSQAIKMPFEDFEVMMPKGYREFLTVRYGDYMLLPPENKRISHHNHYFVDFERRVGMDEVKEIIGKRG